MAPKIILAIVSPLLSLASIRIGFGLEFSIAEPVVSEVLKWNPITVHTERNASIDQDFPRCRFQKFIYRALAIAGRVVNPFVEKRIRPASIDLSTFILEPFFARATREREKEIEKEETKRNEAGSRGETQRRDGIVTLVPCPRRTRDFR